MQEKIDKRSEEIQAEMQDMIETAASQPGVENIQYNDYTTAFLISKVANLEVTLEELVKELESALK